MSEESVKYFFYRYHEKFGFEEIFPCLGFPDALGLRRGKVARIEFESKASNFIIHNHDKSKCDIIICYDNDLIDNIDIPKDFSPKQTKEYRNHKKMQDKINGLEIIELKKFIKRTDSSLPRIYFKDDSNGVLLKIMQLNKSKVLVPSDVQRILQVKEDDKIAFVLVGNMIVIENLERLKP